MIRALPCAISVGVSVPRKGVSDSVVCSSARNGGTSYIPRLEPFSRSKIDRAVKEPPLIQKSENQIADYCSTLEGDESYSCWKAYFELKQLEKCNVVSDPVHGNLDNLLHIILQLVEESPKEEVEHLIIEAGGIKSLIGCLHGVSAIHREKKEADKPKKRLSMENAEARPCPIPDGLPKTQEELEEEERAKMPDSPFTRLLRARGRHPAWYSPAPEHETA